MNDHVLRRKKKEKERKNETWSRFEKKKKWYKSYLCLSVTEKSILKNAHILVGNLKIATFYPS